MATFASVTSAAIISTPEGTSQTLTYTLAGSATGYDISSIVTIYGWRDGANRFAEQNYSISFSTVDTPAFTLFDSMTYDPFEGENGQRSSEVTWTESETNILQSGVTGISFTFDKANTSNTVGVIREIDVFGVATVVPEPSSVALLGLGGLALILRRRK